MRYALRDRRKLHFCEMKQDSDPDTRELLLVPACKPIPFYASWQQASGQSLAAQYGTRLPSIRILYGAPVSLQAGMGVWMDAPEDDQPDYIVIAVKRTPQERVLLVEKRGVYGG